MFTLPEPKTLCFFFNLRKGSWIIGIFTLIAAICNMTIWTAGFGPYALDVLLKAYFYKKDECDEDCTHFRRLGYISLAIGVLIFESVQIIVSSLLIHGLRKEKPRLFISFLVWQIVRLVVTVLVAIAVIVLFKSHAGVVIGFLILLGLLWGLNLYLLFVVNAYKMQVSRAQGTAPLPLIDS